VEAKLSTCPGCGELGHEASRCQKTVMGSGDD
jgi:hypothetical protein